MPEPCITPGRGITSPPTHARVSTSLQVGGTTGQRRRFTTNTRRQPTTIPARTTVEAWLAATPMALDLDALRSVLRRVTHSAPTPVRTSFKGKRVALEA